MRPGIRSRTWSTYRLKWVRTLVSHGAGGLLGLTMLVGSSLFPAGASAQAVCGGPHTTPVLQGSEVGALAAGQAWIQAVAYHGESDRFFDTTGQKRGFPADGRVRASSLYLTTTLGLGRGWEAAVQATTHRLDFATADSRTARTGPGDVRLMARYSPDFRGLRLPLAVRATVKLPGSEFQDAAGHGHVKGAADAAVEVVEFIDFGCSACAYFVREIQPHVQEKYVATGRVHWRVVPFAIPIARNSEAGARAAECAARQDAFWPMHDLLFERQRAWASRRGANAKFVEYAAALGLDPVRFDRCLDSDETRDLIRANAELARRAGVRGTPTFFVGDRAIIGAVDWEHFDEVLDAATSADCR